MKASQRIIQGLPFILATALFCIFLIANLTSRPSAYPEFDVQSVGLLPVQVGGRIQPLDTVARVNLLVIAERQSLSPDMTGQPGERRTAIEWLMDVTMRPEIANNYRIFKLVYPEDLGFEGLKDGDTRFYSFNELAPYIGRILESFQNLDPSNPRDAYEKQIIKLHQSLGRYQGLLQSFHPLDRLDHLLSYYDGFEESIRPGMTAFHRQQAGDEFDEAELARFMGFMLTFQNMAERANLRLIPPATRADIPYVDWDNIGSSLMSSITRGNVDPFVLAYARLTTSFRQDNPVAFNETAAAMLSTLEKRYPEQVTRVHFEQTFNAASPFITAMILYLLAFILTAVGWFGSTNNAFNRTAFWIIFLTFLLHTVGLLARMYIQGRPPVTNLYASAIFVGWGSVLLCLILERLNRNGIANAAGAIIGACSLIVAHNLALLTGDTLEMVQAVLDSNFWLATHVVVITLGYSAMFVAGALGLFFIVRAVFTPGFTASQARNIGRMVYGVICFAALFSLVGTILGGIWADQSWGRFWGWDPKENGALLIVILTAIILHARWGNIAAERGIMNLAILGNIVTSWSWFGTNMLGVGLHSYGFMDSAFIPLMAFWISQLGFILLGCAPYSWWLSDYGKSMARRQRRRLQSTTDPSLQTQPRSS